MISAKDLMTQNPSCCTPESSLREVAKLMVNCDCGEIPVVKSETDKSPIGVVTDRDITTRTVAHGKNPLECKASDVMSTPCITIGLEASLDDCAKLMEKHQIRRLPVVDKSGKLCGIVAQADLARCSERKTGEVVKAVSQPQNDHAGRQSPSQRSF
jgi:CBS domain-containing protein